MMTNYCPHTEDVSHDGSTKETMTRSNSTSMNCVYIVTFKLSTKRFKLNIQIISSCDLSSAKPHLGMLRSIYRYRYQSLHMTLQMMLKGTMMKMAWYLYWSSLVTAACLFLEAAPPGCCGRVLVLEPWGSSHLAIKSRHLKLKLWREHAHIWWLRAACELYLTPCCPSSSSYPSGPCCSCLTCIVGPSAARRCVEKVSLHVCCKAPV